MSIDQYIDSPIRSWLLLFVLPLSTAGCFWCLHRLRPSIPRRILFYLALVHLLFVVLFRYGRHLIPSISAVQAIDIHQIMNAVLLFAFPVLVFRTPKREA